ncbi:DUF4235 domain-containing protein [Aeromicrobium sp. UC242_57]|uniref:DUF4235 domain-containing protein n=1 Tax=Aeromicrobium sp. UC242_57 TaxID=3374624 RepID=UPI0037B0DC23
MASLLFKQVWKRVSPTDGDDPPGPLQSEYPFKEILLAAVLQGAIYAVVKAVIQRQGAKGFQRATGEWPGREPLQEASHGRRQPPSVDPRRDRVLGSSCSRPSSAWSPS